MKKLLMYAVGLFVLASCNPLKNIESTYSSANKSFEENSYAEAYSQYNSLISQYESNQIEVPNDVYVALATCAFRTGKLDEAIVNYQKAYNDSATVSTLKGYIEALKASDKYPEVQKVLEENKGYLENNSQQGYYKSEMFNTAMTLGDEEALMSAYSDMDSMTEKQTLAVIAALENNNKTKSALSLANKTIKEHPDYDNVKEWKGVYYYKFAEKWYKSEMDKYNKDKNYTAYVYLKRELKKISANYKVSMDIFEELHKKYPDEEKYVKYLKNVYLRLEMKNKAEAMNKKLN